VERGLQDLAERWGAVNGVTLSDGRQIPLDESFLLSALRDPDPDIDRLDALFAALQDAHKPAAANGFSASDLNSLKVVLARPEFNSLVQRPNPSADLLRQARDRFLAWLSSLLQKFGGNRNLDLQISSFHFSILAVIASLILVLVLVFIFRSLIIDLVSEARLPAQRQDLEEVLTGETAFKKAQTLSRGGDLRSAVRYLYLSLLLMLDERGLLRYERTKTNREYLRSISHAPEFAGLFAEVVDVFDSVWYGFHTLDEATFRNFSERIEKLKGAEK
jgi:hypothetical protein